jgi:hypothetical protein
MGDCWVVLAAAEPTATQFFAALLALAAEGRSSHWSPEVAACTDGPVWL